MINYIYGLRDPRDGKIKYVGQTRNPRARYAGHVGIPAGRGLNAKEQWIKDLRDLGTRPELVILECPDVGVETSRAERKWICKIQSYGPLFNVKPNKAHEPKTPRRFTAPPMLPESQAAISAYLAQHTG